MNLARPAKAGKGWGVHGVIAPIDSVDRLRAQRLRGALTPCRGDRPWDHRALIPIVATIVLLAVRVGCFASAIEALGAHNSSVAEASGGGSLLIENVLAQEARRGAKEIHEALVACFSVASDHRPDEIHCRDGQNYCRCLTTGMAAEAEALGLDREAHLGVVVMR
jgi:hypothetical protein